MSCWFVNERIKLFYWIILYFLYNTRYVKQNYMKAKEIKLELERLGQEWNELEQTAKNQSFLSLGAMQDSLMNHLESVRASIEEYFNKVPLSRERCKAWLNKLLDVSEKLKFSYVAPATYEESSTIFDTIKMVDKRVIMS